MRSSATIPQILVCRNRRRCRQSGKFTNSYGDLLRVATKPAIIQHVGAFNPAISYRMVFQSLLPRVICLLYFKIAFKLLQYQRNSQFQLYILI